MSIYAVGDLQGCLTPLQQLLDDVHFTPGTDQLWCAGDVVNRGPQSLETLRFLYQQREHCVLVLGNHDLHLLAVAFGGASLKRGDTLQEILDAPDAEELLHWLRHQPLVHRAHGYTMVHAGIAPQWSCKKAAKLSKEVEDVIQGKHYKDYFENMYGNTPDYWSKELEGMDRLRAITNYLTRLRFCYSDKRMDFKCKHGPDDAPKELTPWFLMPNRKAKGKNILFGHWAALEGECNVKNMHALDTGCVWGGELTMLRLAVDGEKEKLYHRPGLQSEEF